MLNLDTHNNLIKIFRYIILIPHRDAVKPLEEYRQKLFSIGVASAHSFPLAAPLAEVSRPFRSQELKELALYIRSLTKSADGKILCEKKCAEAKSRHLSFFGPSFNLAIEEGAFPETAKDKLIRVLNPAVLCASLCKMDSVNDAEPPAISFRAASVSNLAIRPLPELDYSFEWEIGESVWLPAWKKNPSALF